MSRNIAAGALALALSACSVGIGPQGASPTTRLQVPVSYQEAYRRAVAQAEECLRGPGNYEVRGNVYEAERRARMYVQAPVTDARMAQVDVQAVGEDRSDVTVTMWGRNTWNDRALLAMRQAIEFGYTSCWPAMIPEKGEGRRR
jgi:hypothetical protein